MAVVDVAEIVDTLLLFIVALLLLFAGSVVLCMGFSNN
jgi:hypothetical protein